MFIDIVVVILIVFGFVKGFSKGLIISLFNTIAWILGIFLALKLSSSVAIYFQEKYQWHNNFSPLISFAVIILLIYLLVHFLGKALEKIIEVAHLGILNKILGGLLIGSVFLFIGSTLIWLLNEGNFISAEVKLQSKLYNYIIQVSPFVIHQFGIIAPIVKNALSDFSTYFNQHTLIPPTK